MKYRTEYPRSYDEGIVNKSITLSKMAFDLIRENEISNESAFINDLIIDALNEKDLFKKRIVKQISTLRQELQQKHNVGSTFELIDV
jgi:hypothetical protein